MNAKLSLRFFAAIFSSVAPLAAAVETAAITVAVVDDERRPVSNATVGMGVSDSRGQKASGMTDSNGLFSASLKMRSSLYVRAEKKDYYKSSGYPWSGPSSAGLVPPVNVYTVVLKRIVNPVAMPMFIVNAKVPRYEATVGFDLERGDWVAPWGKGSASDLIVKAHHRKDGPRDYDKYLEISFANRPDGIVVHDEPNGEDLKIASVLPIPQVAPSNGYATNWVAFVSQKPGEPATSNRREANRQYVLRVRSRENERGELVSANYGWIATDFDLSWPGVYMNIRYYFNPDPHSRSLEPEEIAKRQTGP